MIAKLPLAASIPGRSPFPHLVEATGTAQAPKLAVQSWLLSIHSAVNSEIGG
jgi:hypothetical protein